MDEETLRSVLADLPLGGLRYFDQVGSTNDEALAWAAQGAPDFSLVVADEQTSGRGRQGRWWHTPPDAALAFSLVLAPSLAARKKNFPRLTALGALAVIEGLNHLTGLTGQIKWPNDVLLDGKKVAGILAESSWLGDSPQNFVLGIGINIAPEAVPPPNRISFPATSLETIFGQTVDRWALLRAVLQAVYSWRSAVHSPAFLTAWETSLAYRGAEVRIEQGGGSFTGILHGLDSDGGLVLIGPDGALNSFAAGEVRLRPGAQG